MPKSDYRMNGTTTKVLKHSLGEQLHPPQKSLNFVKNNQKESLKIFFFFNKKNLPMNLEFEDTSFNY